MNKIYLQMVDVFFAGFSVVHEFPSAFSHILIHLADNCAYGAAHNGIKEFMHFYAKENCCGFPF